MAERYATVHISGDLGRAIASTEDATYVIDEKQVEIADDRDIDLFFEFALEIEAFRSGATAYDIMKQVRFSAALSNGLQNILMGMDGKLSPNLRAAAISACRPIIDTDRYFRTIINRVFDWKRQSQWDLSGAINIAEKQGVYWLALLYSLAENEILISAIVTQNFKWWAQATDSDIKIVTRWKYILNLLPQWGHFSRPNDKIFIREIDSTYSRLVIEIGIGRLDKYEISALEFFSRFNENLDRVGSQIDSQSSLDELFESACRKLGVDLYYEAAAILNTYNRQRTPEVVAQDRLKSDDYVRERHPLTKSGDLVDDYASYSKTQYSLAGSTLGKIVAVLLILSAGLFAFFITMEEISEIAKLIK